MSVERCTPSIMTQHIPVLLQETIRILNPKPGEIVFDGTFGGGGHAAVFVDAIVPNGSFVGVDRDPERVTHAESFLRAATARGVRAAIYVGTYGHAEKFLARNNTPRADILFLDLGFSSFQIDNPLRGFSFQHDGPLDMRYNPHDGITAAELVNTFSEEALSNIIYEYGEEPAARVIARRICEQRKEKRIYGTHELAEIVSRAKHTPRGKIHPATKTFQALRIYVNDELNNLKLFLSAIPFCVNAGGRVGIISFHGLEDKIVKNAFRGFVQEKNAVFLTKKPIVSSQEEISGNPRARSAKFRGITFV